MFLVVVRIPEVPDAIARAATASGQVRADAQRRLAGVLPRVLLVDADRALVQAAQTALEAAGFQALAFDPALTPGDDERLVARSLELHLDELVVIAGVGVETRHAVPSAAISFVQRGTRLSTSSETVTTQERKFSLGRAVLTSGLKMTKTVSKDTKTSTETREAFLLLHRNDGGPDIVLYEQRLDYRFLGAKLQPMSRANLDQTLALVLALAPHARVDDRVTKPGFVTGIPGCGADPMDVALHLVHLAHLVE